MIPSLEFTFTPSIPLAEEGSGEAISLLDWNAYQALRLRSYQAFLSLTVSASYLIMTGLLICRRKAMVQSHKVGQQSTVQGVISSCTEMAQCHGKTELKFLRLTGQIHLEAHTQN